MPKSLFSIRETDNILILDIRKEEKNENKLIYLYEILINNNNLNLTFQNNFTLEKMIKEKFEDCFHNFATFNISIKGNLKNAEKSLSITKQKIKK